MQTVRAMAERAIAVARRTGTTRVEAGALITLGLARAGDDVPAALQLLRDGIDMATQRGFIAIANRGYGYLYYVSETTEARRVFAEWESYSRRVGYRDVTMVYVAAEIAVEDADLDAVVRCSAELTGQTFAAPFVRLAEAMVHVVREGPGQGLPVVEAARKRVAAAHALGKKSGVALALQTLLVAGEFRRALEFAGIAAAVISAPNGNAGERADLNIVTSALHAARELDDEVALDLWAARARELQSARGISRFAGVYLDADALAARHDLSGAARLFVDVADALGLGFGAVTSTLTRLRAVDLLRGVDRTAASAQLERVVDYWRKGKATWFLGELERWAAARNLAFPRDAEPIRVGKKQLTEREREIATLVAQGLTNKSIAEQLVISERTAEGHIQRILDKLDFRSRAQIAAWIAETRRSP